MESVIEILSKVPATAWTAIVTAIMTSGVAYISIAYTNRENNRRMQSQHEHERKLRHDEIVRKRGEELYVIVKKFCKRVVSDHFPYVRAMKGQLSYSDALYMTIKSGEKQNYDPERMNMIVDIYFPTLSEHISALVHINAKVLGVREEFRDRYEEGSVKNKKRVSHYLDEINKLIKATKELENKVAIKVKNMQGEI